MLSRKSRRQLEGVAISGSGVSAGVAEDLAAAKSGRVYIPNALPMFRENRKDIRDRAFGLSEDAIAARRQQGERRRQEREAADLEDALAAAKGTHTGAETMWQHMMRDELSKRAQRAEDLKKDSGGIKQPMLASGKASKVDK